MSICTTPRATRVVYGVMEGIVYRIAKKPATIKLKKQNSNLTKKGEGSGVKNLAVLLFFIFVYILQKGLVGYNVVANEYITSIFAGYFTSNRTNPTAIFTFMVRKIGKR